MKCLFSLGLRSQLIVGDDGGNKENFNLALLFVSPILDTGTMCGEPKSWPETTLLTFEAMEKNIN